MIKGRVTTTEEWLNGAKGHVGAGKRTNNTAEVQAVIEVLFFLLAQVEAASPLIKLRSPVLIHSDSRYAVDIIRNGTRATANSVIRNIMVHLWKRTRLACDVRIVWVRGHSNDVGHALADRLAGEGAEEEIDTDLWRWRPRDWGYSEFRRDNPSSFANEFSDDSFHNDAGPRDKSCDGT